MRAPHTSPNPVIAALTTVIGFVTKLREIHARRRIVHSLAGLDDHLLRDIGLNRCDVDSALVESALTDGTLVLAERVRDMRRHQRAMAHEAQAWATLAPETVRRTAA